MDLKHRNFLKLLDFTPEEIGGLIDLAAELKAKKKKRRGPRYAAGKNIALIFEKPALEPAAPLKWQPMIWVWGRRISIPPVLRSGKREHCRHSSVLGRMFDGIEYRGFGQEIVEELGRYAGVPVWNGLTNEAHPTQILADFLTMREHFGKLAGLNFVYMGDARYNMGNSLMVGCAKMGVNFTACAPRVYFPEEKLIEQCRGFAAESGAQLRFLEDPMEATRGADVIYTDVWVSMGEPAEVWAERIAALAPYQVNRALMDNAGSQCRFMHCLPAFHDWKTTVGKEMGQKFGREAMEVTDEVFESEQSIVFDEAENRMHTIKAVMAATLGA